MHLRTRLYPVVRDLHLYAGLFVSPFILVFSVSVFFLVHAWLPEAAAPSKPRTASDLPVPDGLDKLSGRERIDALKPVLAAAGVHGEVGWVNHRPKQQQLVVPVSVPGRMTTVTIDLAKREATVEERVTGLADAVVTLHKSPGPHLVAMRKNWSYMKLWAWLADATVYLTLLVTVTGLYLWYALRAERKTGLAWLATGTATFFFLVYALIH